MALLTSAEATVIKKCIKAGKLPSLEPGTIWITKWAGKTPSEANPQLRKALRKASQCATSCRVALKSGMWSDAKDEWREAIQFYRLHKRLVEMSAKKAKTSKK